MGCMTPAEHRKAGDGAQGYSWVHPQPYGVFQLPVLSPRGVPAASRLLAEIQAAPYHHYTGHLQR